MRLLMTIALWIISATLAVHWFGWQLLVVLFFWTWANNLDIGLKVENVNNDLQLIIEQAINQSKPRYPRGPFPR